MSDWKFEPEDFAGWADYPSKADIKGIACALANAKLKEWLEKAPKVYGEEPKKDLEHDAGPVNTFHIGPWEEMPWATHTARLVDIKEIKD